MLPEGGRDGSRKWTEIKRAQGTGQHGHQECFHFFQRGEKTHWDVVEDLLRVLNYKGAKIQVAKIIEASKSLKTKFF